MGRSIPSRDAPAAPSAQQEVARLLEQHGGKIYQLGLKVCGRPEDAEDLLQETFLHAFRKWRQFEGRSDPSSWLYTIATRACWRRRRPRAGEPRVMPSLSELVEERGEMADLDSLGGPHERAVRSQAHTAVETAIGRLPLHFRLPLVLKEIAELSLAETAAILGIKEATAKTRVHRGRLLLRRELEERLPRKEAPPHDHSKAVCLDLLAAKQEALDRGADFPVPAAELCARCRPVLATLDLTAEACHAIGRGELPREIRQAVMARLEE